MKPLTWFYLVCAFLTACAGEPETTPASNPSAAPAVTLRATPGGPSGWTVRYTAVPSGFAEPVRYAFSGCGPFDSRAGVVQEGNTLTCHHLEPGERAVTVTATDAAGKAGTSSASVSIAAAEVPYRGMWRWQHEDGHSGHFTITHADIYSRGSLPFDEFASRGRVLACSEAACEAAIFFGQSGGAQPYAFNLRVGALDPAGDATFGLSAEGQQLFRDGALTAVKISGEVWEAQ